MTYEDYWAAVEKLKAIPQHLSSLSVGTKKKLMKIKPEEMVELMKAAIEQVN